MPVDPQAKALLDMMASMRPAPMNTLTPQEARAQTLATRPAVEPEPVGRVEDRVIPGPGGDLPVRIYWPEGTGPFPALVFFHGGGWVICNLDTHDGVCRSLANGARCVTVSVDYRLAPEAKFPAAADDCYAATKWVADNAATLDVDPRRIAIGGDSAGGNLTAAVALMARDKGGPSLVYQLMIYPVTDYSFGTTSYQDNGAGQYMLTTDMMRWFWDLYLPDAESGAHPYASPLRATDLSGLPPALVITAEFDPLRDEGEAYAQKLREAGNQVASSRYDGMFHGFFSMAANVDKAKQAVDEATDALKGAFAKA